MKLGRFFDTQDPFTSILDRSWHTH